MKCTIENLNKVFDLVSEKHVDSGESGADLHYGMMKATCLLLLVKRLN